MIAPGLQRRLRVLSAWGYLVVRRLCLLCCFCFLVFWVVAWCSWWFARANFVSPVTSSPTRPAYCATDVVKGRQSNKKKSCGAAFIFGRCVGAFLYLIFGCLCFAFSVSSFCGCCVVPLSAPSFWSLCGAFCVFIFGRCVVPFLCLLALVCKESVSMWQRVVRHGVLEVTPIKKKQ